MLRTIKKILPIIVCFIAILTKVSVAQSEYILPEHIYLNQVPSIQSFEKAISNPTTIEVEKQTTKNNVHDESLIFFIETEEKEDKDEVSNVSFVNPLNYFDRRNNNLILLVAKSIGNAAIVAKSHQLCQIERQALFQVFII